VRSSPAIDSNGTVFVNSRDGKLYAIDGSSGNLLWSFTTPTSIDLSSPAVLPSGIIVICTGKSVMAVKRPGVMVWSYITGAAIVSSPAISLEGNVYVTSTDWNVYALNGTSGELLWIFSTIGIIYSSPAVSDVYDLVYTTTGSLDTNMYALNKTTGALVWKRLIGITEHSNHMLAIGPDGNLFVGIKNNYLYAINGISGATIWSYYAGGYVFTSPAYTYNGTVIIGLNSGKIVGIDSQTGIEQWA
jgi:eukaryotic-like serine/threonine-protein kinase